MQQCTTFIYLPGSAFAVPAGVLRELEGQYFFQYGKRYLEREDAQPVDLLRLPLRKGRMALDAENLGSIRDSSPDYWGRLVFQKLFHAPQPSEIDYLMAQNAVRTGCTIHQTL